MKKFFALLLVVSVILTLALTCSADNNERYKPLNVISKELFESHIYPAGLLYVNVIFTEANSVILEVGIGDERVDYHLLQPDEWVFVDGKIFIRENVINTLVEDPSNPS